MLRSRLSLVGSLPFLVASLFRPIYVSAQQAAQQYKAAQSILKAHTSEDGILNDDSPEARSALAKMWGAAGQAVIEILGSHPNASPQEIDNQLCKQGIAAAGCNEGFSPQHDIVRLGTDLYAVAVATETGGTVLIIGRRNGKPAQLWSLAAASVTRQRDPQDLIGAWLPDRTGLACRKDGSPVGKTARLSERRLACRKDGSPHNPGSCGPLYSELGLLPENAQGRPRFYIDAGYEQLMGATIGKQTSLWQWDGDHAELLWINIYPFMIDQALGTSFDNDKGTLHVGEKGEFRTMNSCGSCIDRPLDQSVLITKTGIEDLGIRSLTPELDRINDLFWRLQKGQPTIRIAAPQVTSFLKRGIVEAKQYSKKVDPSWFSVGMIDSSTVRLTSSGADVCLEPDSEFGTLKFTLKRLIDGGYFIEHVAAAPSGEECSRGEFLPGAPTSQ